MNGAERITAERQRQLDAEGWTPEHDDGWYKDELVRAAICYAMPPDSLRESQVLGRSLRQIIWPGNLWPWKPSRDRIRELEKAGALIAAEIDRLVRASDTERGAAKDPPKG